IHNPAGVPGRDGAIFAERRLQLGEPFHSCLRPAMVILAEHVTRGLTTMVPKLHGNQFLLEPPSLIGVVRTALRAQSKFVLHLAGDALLLAIELGCRSEEHTSELQSPD